MNESELSVIFEKWHKTTKQYTKYRLNHNKYTQPTGSVVYYDHRTNWAWLAFKGGYESKSLGERNE